MITRSFNLLFGVVSVRASTLTPFRVLIEVEAALYANEVEMFVHIPVAECCGNRLLAKGLFGSGAFLCCFPTTLAFAHVGLTLWVHSRQGFKPSTNIRPTSP